MISGASILWCAHANRSRPLYSPGWFAKIPRPGQHHGPFWSLLHVACALTLSLSFSSAFNAHPDEIWHITSVSYFLFEPYPAVSNTLQSTHTFSSYHSSYLSTGELYYPIAAVWTSLLSTLTDLPIDQVQVIRLFSVTCFVFLICLLSRQKNHGLLLPFLITPQLWYVFGYANSDWFGVAVATLLLLFLNLSRFTFHRFVIGGSFARFLQLIPDIYFARTFMLFETQLFDHCHLLLLRAFSQHLEKKVNCERPDSRFGLLSDYIGRLLVVHRFEIFFLTRDSDANRRGARNASGLRAGKEHQK